jgi:hypothetical protein
VSGSVQVDGKPLERGAINFIPAQGSQGPGAGTSITDGYYELDAANGAIVGPCRVEIRGFRKTGRKISPMGTPMDEEIQVVPSEFNESSTLIREVKEGDHTMDFDLPGKSLKKS